MSGAIDPETAINANTSGGDKQEHDSDNGNQLRFSQKRHKRVVKRGISG